MAGRSHPTALISKTNRVKSGELVEFGHRAAYHTFMNTLWYSLLCIYAAQHPGILQKGLSSQILSWPRWPWWICVRPRPTTSACLLPTAWAWARPATSWLSQQRKQVESVFVILGIITITAELADSFFFWWKASLKCVLPLSTWGSSPGHAAGGLHFSQHQSDLEGKVTVCKSSFVDTMKNILKKMKAMVNTKKYIY